MDVPNSMNKMRFSPVLVACLAASATLGLSNTAKGQTISPLAPPHSGASQKKLDSLLHRFRDHSSGSVVAASPVAAIATSAKADNAITVPVVTQPQGAAQYLAQDDQRQIQLTPSPEPRQPDVPSTVPSPTPSDSAAPAEATPTPTDEATPPAASDDNQPTGEPLTPLTPSETPLTPLSPQTPQAPDETPSTQTGEPEPRVLVSEVAVSGAEGDLRDRVYAAIQTQPGRTTTRSQLQEDINAIFATGYFSNVRAVPEDTPLGVRVTFEVQPNPVLQTVRVEGTTVLPETVINDAFKDQYGRITNLVDLQEGIKVLTKWYQDNGYVLAQVVEAPAIAPDGTVTLQVAEGQIEDLRVRFINKEGEDTDAKGNPIRGRTRDFIITREFELKPGQVFNRRTVEKDLQRVYGLGIFDDVKLSLAPGTDPRQVVVVVDVTEKNTGSIAAGAGISSASGLFGTLSYQQQNLGGNNQKLGAEVQVGQRELLFDFSFTDPWIAGDPYRTSYTFNLFRRRTISLIFDGGDPEIELPNGDRPRVVRTGGGLSFTRPLSKDVFRPAEWVASLGLQYQRVAIRDADGELSPIDELNNNLSFSGTGKDDLFTVQFGIARDRRNDPLRPITGSLLRLASEQSIPIGQGNIFFNRLRGSYSQYVPVRLFNLSQGCQKPNASPSECPQTLAFNVQAGTVLGDLPPYEAFSVGGSNSVRGYGEGDLAAARTFVQATVEYRFPIFSIVSGALFVDAATSFGSQDNVPGNPGGVRGKPGSGFGYGLGLRVQSPLGPIRVDYGINDEGESRLHFGIGERF